MPVRRSLPSCPPFAAVSMRLLQTPVRARRMRQTNRMACILLDVDGVLHVSGEPIPGAAEAVARLRHDGHAPPFVTNKSTRPRDLLAQDLRGLGIQLTDDE